MSIRIYAQSDQSKLFNQPLRTSQPEATRSCFTDTTHLLILDLVPLVGALHTWRSPCNQLKLSSLPSAVNTAPAPASSTHPSSENGTILLSGDCSFSPPKQCVSRWGCQLPNNVCHQPQGKGYHPRGSTRGSPGIPRCRLKAQALFLGDPWLSGIHALRHVEKIDPERSREK